MATKLRDGDSGQRAQHTASSRGRWYSSPTRAAVSAVVAVGGTDTRDRDPVARSGHLDQDRYGPVTEPELIAAWHTVTGAGLDPGAKTGHSSGACSRARDAAFFASASAAGRVWRRTKEGWVKG